MHIAIINNETSRLADLIEACFGHTLEIVNWQDVPTSLDKVHLADVIIFSGSSIHAIKGRRNKEVYDSQRTLLLESDKPVLGICAGFQLIVDVFGGRMERREEKITGIKKIEILRPDPLFAGITQLTAHEYHRWVVTEVSEDLIKLAKSEDGYEIVKHFTKPIYGVQFHPEVRVPENTGYKILSNFLRLY